MIIGYSPTLPSHEFYMSVRGFSPEAESVEQAVGDGLLNFAKPRIEPLISEIWQIVADSAASEGGVRVDPEAAWAAMNFAYSLPLSLPAPELAPDADGEIMFDWIGPSGKMFSVSVGKSGRIAYAGRFEDGSKVHGMERFSTACPREVVRGIARATL
jgi:hypothetical protein